MSAHINPKQQGERTIIIPTLMEAEASLPFYGTEGAAGADVKAFVSEDILIESGCWALISTGLRFDIPEGYEIQVRPRSGLAFKHGVTVLNAPGTIDHDYKGELKILLINHGKDSFVVTPGMRIAQLVAAPVIRAEFFVSEEISASRRGANGFGSTGLH
jgi:dUTP pyrophosphatase